MKNKRILLFFIFLSAFVASNSQNPTYKQKLFYTCKVWGFVKYFHSRVSVCQVNWDSILIVDLPLVKNAVTNNDFNNVLDTILKAAGPMALTASPPCDTMAPELKYNLNFGWLGDPMLRADVQTQLDTIRNNFRPHPECWVQNNSYTTSNYSFLIFPYDSLMLNIDDYYNYPNEANRLLEVFSFWNIVQYFHPYNYIQNQPWDSSLYQNILSFSSAGSDYDFYNAFLKLSSNTNDGHTGALTYDYYSSAPLNGYYSPSNLVLKYIPGHYIVGKSGVPGLVQGDEILNINGLSMKQWEDSLAPYVLVSDSAAFHLDIASYVVCAPWNSNMTIAFYDSTNTYQVINTTCDSVSPWRYYYPNDTLQYVQWKYWPSCNIGYINEGNMQDTGSEISNTYTTLQNTDAIIFDIRNYPVSAAVYELFSNYFFPPGYTYIAKLMMPDVTYPGTFYWQPSYTTPGTSNPYKGKIIVLFNEQTISAAEANSMALGELPNSVKVGSQTDGADGNITYLNLNQDIQTGFSSLGYYYPNGDTTQRIGIKPDSVVYPTRKGIYHHRDEELEKALQITGCPTAVKEVKDESEKVNVFPNPTTGTFTLSISNVNEKCNVEIYNVMGQKVNIGTVKQVQGDYTLDLSNRPNGIYFYRVLKENGGLVGEGKVVIEK